MSALFLSFGTKAGPCGGGGPDSSLLLPLACPAQVIGTVAAPRLPCQEDSASEGEKQRAG